MAKKSFYDLPAAEQEKIRARERKLFRKELEKLRKKRERKAKG